MELKEKQFDMEDMQRVPQGVLKRLEKKLSTLFPDIKIVLGQKHQCSSQLPEGH